MTGSTTKVLIALKTGQGAMKKSKVEQIRGFEPPPPVWKTGMLTIEHHICISGAGYLTRTDYLRVTKPMFYQVN